MSKDRPWVLENEVRNHPNAVRYWHYYGNQYEPAKCGHPPIPGMPIVSEKPEATVTCASRVCEKCAGVA